ncbi:MAG: hypothetical protein QXL97_00250 [Candidatus Aenigmatarchaeota archaeon]
MKCIRCGSRRLIEFVDSFGKERVFCRDCLISLEKGVFVKSLLQRKVPEFYFKNQIKPWNVKP